MSCFRNTTGQTSVTVISGSIVGWKRGFDRRVSPRDDQGRDRSWGGRPSRSLTVSDQGWITILRRLCRRSTPHRTPGARSTWIQRHGPLRRSPPIVAAGSHRHEPIGDPTASRSRREWQPSTGGPNVATPPERRTYPRPTVSPGCMARPILINCPNTGNPVSTGMTTTPEDFERDDEQLEHRFGPCPECGQSHTWNTSDAWLASE